MEMKRRSAGCTQKGNPLPFVTIWSGARPVVITLARPVFFLECRFHRRFIREAVLV